jgi:hypothetical protein
MADTTETKILKTLVKHLLFVAAPNADTKQIDLTVLLQNLPFDLKAEAAARDKLSMLWRLASPDERKFLDEAFDILVGKTLADLLGKPEEGDQ